MTYKCCSTSQITFGNDFVNCKAAFTRRGLLRICTASITWKYIRYSRRSFLKCLIIASTYLARTVFYFFGFDVEYKTASLIWVEWTSYSFQSTSLKLVKLLLSLALDWKNKKGVKSSGSQKFLLNKKRANCSHLNLRAINNTWTDNSCETFGSKISKLRSTQWRLFRSVSSGKFLCSADKLRHFSTVMTVYSK